MNSEKPFEDDYLEEVCFLLYAQSTAK